MAQRLHHVPCGTSPARPETPARTGVTIGLVGRAAGCSAAAGPAGRDTPIVATPRALRPVDPTGSAPGERGA